jgi:hypothetical protein
MVDGGFGLPRAAALAAAVHQPMGEPPHRGVQPEAVKMYLERGLMVAVAQEALNMKADGKEAWCISWLQWFWQEEIERAIWDVQQGRS